MRKAFTTVLLALVAVAPSAALGLSFKVTGRSDNSWDLQPDIDKDKNTINMNLRDCIEMREVEFRFDITVDSTDNTSGKTLYIFAGTECDQSLDKCIKLNEVASARSQEAVFTLFDLYLGGAESAIASNPLLNKFMDKLDAGLESTIDDLFSEQMDALIETVCTGVEKTESGVYLYAALLSNEDDPASGTWSEPVTVLVDVGSPTGPTGIEAVPGDGKVEVTWDGESVTDHAGFYVLYAALGPDSGDGADAGADASCAGGTLEVGGEYSPDLQNEAVESLDGTSQRVGGLENGVTYQITVVSRDAFLNISRISQVVCATPGSTSGFFEEYVGAGGKGGGRYCFVATAAFGSYDHPAVKLLRRFRDDFLARMPGGEALIAAYYAVGPAMAEPVRQSAALRAAARGILWSAAGIAWILTQAGVNGAGIGAGGLLAFILGLSISRRRRG